MGCHCQAVITANVCYLRPSLLLSSFWSNKCQSNEKSVYGVVTQNVIKKK